MHREAGTLTRGCCCMSSASWSCLAFLLLHPHLLISLVHLLVFPSLRKDREDKKYVRTYRQYSTCFTTTSYFPQLDKKKAPCHATTCGDTHTPPQHIPPCLLPSSSSSSFACFSLHTKGVTRRSPIWLSWLRQREGEKGKFLGFLFVCSFYWRICEGGGGKEEGLLR